MKKLLCILMAMLTMAATAEELMELELVDDVVVIEDEIPCREPETLFPDEEMPMATPEPIPQLRAAATTAPCTAKPMKGSYSATLGDTLTIPLTGCTHVTIGSVKNCSATITKKGLVIYCDYAGTAKVVLECTHNAKLKSTISVKVKKNTVKLKSRTYTLKIGEELKLSYSELGFSDRYPRFTYHCSNKYLSFFSPRNGAIILKPDVTKKTTITITLSRYDDYGNSENCKVTLKCVK